jgi:hypothetical protein
MNSLRGISRKVDAILLMVMAGLALSLVLAWNYYQTRKMTAFEKDGYAANLLAYDLPEEAAEILEQSIAMQPLSAKSLKKRRALADIYMKELNRYDKALKELVFIQSFMQDSSKEVEQDIRLCLQRLGRSYDVERRAMLDAGINPIKNEVASQTLVRIGNKQAIGVEDLKSRLLKMGISEKELDRRQLNAIVQAMAREKLLQRAAKRENIDRERDFIDRVHEFEDNLRLKLYLEQYVFDQLDIDENEISDFIRQNAKHFISSDRISYSCYSFADALSAEKGLKAIESGIDISASGVDYRIVTNMAEVTKDQLPDEIKSLNYNIAGNIEFFGPVKIGSDYLVYRIHEFKPGEKVDESQIQAFARKSVLEKKQQMLLNQKIEELAQAEEMKINEDQIESAFFKNASETRDLKDKQQK